MITLYGFGSAYGLPDASAFVVKTEMLLKLAGLDYRKVTGNLRQAPKGKLPYIEDEGVIIADSTFIRRHIEQKYSFDFDAHLSGTDRGIAWAVEKMLEDNLYWVTVDARWMHASNFAKGPARIFKNIPAPLRTFIVATVLRKIRRNLQGHGMGRHTPQEINDIAARDLAALAAILGEKPYLMGNQPCGADATAFAFTLDVLCPVFDTPSREAAASHPNLVAYAHRMSQAYFPERLSQ